MTSTNHSGTFATLISSINNPFLLFALLFIPGILFLVVGKLLLHNNFLSRFENKVCEKLYPHTGINAHIVGKIWIAFGYGWLGFSMLSAVIH